MSSEIGFVATEYFRSFGGRYLSHHFKRSFVSTENNRCQLSAERRTRARSNRPKPASRASRPAQASMAVEL